jgi:hypothetical protein
MVHEIRACRRVAQAGGSGSRGEARARAVGSPWIASLLVIAAMLLVVGRASAALQQQAEIFASDPATGDLFGYTVAISGNTAVVGAPYKNTGRGEAYVFVNNGTGWVQQGPPLLASDGVTSDFFASSVAVSGTTILLGTPNRSSNRGVVYVFGLVGGTWTQLAELTASNAAAGDDFGNSVALSGTTAVIGAFHKASTAGAAYVFTGSGSVWQQTQQLTTPADATPNGAFGASVAIDPGATTIVVGGTFVSGAGAAYVFGPSGGSWSQVAELKDPSPASNESFGTSVATNGTITVVGANGKNGYVGVASVFTLQSGTWPLVATLSPSDTADGGASGEGFGSSVALSGSTIVVTGPYRSNGPGAAYVFSLSGSTVTQTQILTPSDATTGESFGSAMAAAGKTFVVGARNRASNTGAAYLLTLPPPVANPAGPYVITAGSGVTLDGSMSYETDPGASLTSYGWDLNGDGTIDVSSASAVITVPWSTLQSLAPQNVPVTITLSVTDSTGAVSKATTTLTINAATPSTPALPPFATLALGGLLALMGANLVYPKRRGAM